MTVDNIGLSAHRLVAAYADAPRADRLHVRLRWRSCPFRDVEHEVPPEGNVLEVGCGHGLFSLYLATASAGRHVTGTDIDERKIALASTAKARLGLSDERLRFEVSRAGSLPAGPWDAVVIVDVLYLLGPEPRVALIRRCADALSPDGRLIVKESARTPRWKYALTVLQEHIATRVLRITQGSDVSFMPPEELAHLMQDAGLRTTSRDLSRRSLHPHHVVIGTKHTAAS